MRNVCVEQFERKFSFLLWTETVKVKRKARSVEEHLHVEVDYESNKGKHAELLNFSNSSCIPGSKKRELHDKIFTKRVSLLGEAMSNPRRNIKRRRCVYNSPCYAKCVFQSQNKGDVGNISAPHRVGLSSK